MEDGEAIALAIRRAGGRLVMQKGVWLCGGALNKGEHH